MKRTLVVLLWLSVLSAQAQELNFWQKVNNMLTIVKKIDTMYIYQPKQGFTLGLFSNVQRAGIDVTGMFTVNTNDGKTQSGVSKYSLRESLNPKIGLELGYGKLVLGYGMEVVPRERIRNGHWD